MTTPPAPWRSRIVRRANVAPGRLLANPANYRLHPPEQRAAMIEMLDTIGWVQDVVVNLTTGHLLDGHLRTEIAVERGEKIIPVVYVRLTEEEERQVLAALDPITGMATVDASRLAALLGGLRLGDGALSAMLADLAERSGLGPLTAAAGYRPEPDDAPPVRPQRAVTVKTGELYRLGPHRLLVGDSTQPEAVARLMNGTKARMCFTDPPWNVGVASRTGLGQMSSGEAKARGGRTIENDDLLPADFEAFLALAAQRCIESVSGDLYCVMGSSAWPTIDHALRAAGYHWSATIAWVKNSLVLTRRNYHTRYEPLWYGWPSDGKSSWQGSRSEDDAWEIPRPQRSESHPTMKPVALVERALRNSSEPGDIVLDLFAGSGTTCVAAERLGRIAYLMEIDPQYAQVIIDRWEAYTGGKAELA